MNFPAPFPFIGFPRSIFDLQSTEKQALREAPPNVDKLKSVIGKRADMLAKRHMNKVRQLSDLDENSGTMH